MLAPKLDDQRLCATNIDYSAIGLLRDPAFGSTGSRLSAYERLCLPWFFSDVFIDKG